MGFLSLRHLEHFKCFEMCPRYKSKILKIYVTASALTDPIYDLVHRYRLLKGKEDRNAKTNRFGTSKVERPKGRLTWFHAASLGESLAVLPLIDKLLSNDKHLHVLLTQDHTH